MDRTYDEKFISQFNINEKQKDFCWNINKLLIDNISSDVLNQMVIFIKIDQHTIRNMDSRADISNKMLTFILYITQATQLTFLNFLRALREYVNPIFHEVTTNHKNFSNILPVDAATTEEIKNIIEQLPRGKIAIKDIQYKLFMTLVPSQNIDNDKCFIDDIHKQDRYNFLKLRFLKNSTKTDYETSVLNLAILRGLLCDLTTGDYHPLRKSTVAEVNLIDLNSPSSATGPPPGLPLTSSSSSQLQFTFEPPPTYEESMNPSHSMLSQQQQPSSSAYPSITRQNSDLDIEKEKKRILHLFIERYPSQSSGEIVNIQLEMMSFIPQNISSNMIDHLSGESKKIIFLNWIRECNDQKVFKKLKKFLEEKTWWGKL